MGLYQEELDSNGLPFSRLISQSFSEYGQNLDGNTTHWQQAEKWRVHDRREQGRRR